MALPSCGPLAFWATLHLAMKGLWGGAVWCWGFGLKAQGSGVGLVYRGLRSRSGVSGLGPT